MNILGISAYYHDSAACLVCDGVVVAAAQEERFTRKKQDAVFPKEAIKYCLGEVGIDYKSIDSIIFYDKPLLKFERLLETYISYAPFGFASFLSAMPLWLKEKLFLKDLLRKELASVFGIKKKDCKTKLFFSQHHQAHAASAFFPSPYKSAAVLCLDGVGEWATTSLWQGKDNKLTPIWEINFPHSLGLLYSAFTYYCGFRVNSGEYKLMGLAPYGEPKYTDLIKDNLVDIKEDGTFRLNMKYFDFPAGLKMTNSKFNKLFGDKPRAKESDITQKHMDIAASIQVVTEEIILKLARAVRTETGEKNLCLAGGVALNCVANGKIIKENIFENVWIQPAAGDAGGAIGAALSFWYDYLGNERESDGVNDKTAGSYLGPKFSEAEIKEDFDNIGAVYTLYANEAFIEKAVDVLVNENVLGWMQGRMEFGPRALGGRSILGDARSQKMQSIMNLKIKYRESFRPFAPSVLKSEVDKYFDLQTISPYMLLVVPIKDSIRKEMTDMEKKLFGIEKLKIPRSELPAVTHVDYSARIQTVDDKTNKPYYDLLVKFKEKTGCGVLVNTSFNVRGEPIVCTPKDAYRCFMRTEMDYLAVGNFLLAKKDQPALGKDDSWKAEFELD